MAFNLCLILSWGSGNVLYQQLVGDLIPSTQHEEIPNQSPVEISIDGWLNYRLVDNEFLLAQCYYGAWVPGDFGTRRSRWWIFRDGDEAQASSERARPIYLLICEYQHSVLDSFDCFVAQLRPNHFLSFSSVHPILLFLKIQWLWQIFSIHKLDMRIYLSGWHTEPL